MPVFRWTFGQLPGRSHFVHGNYGEPYVSTVQGPDGAVYTISGNRLYAMDNLTNLSITVSSSNPDERLAVRGQPITFTAVVTNPAADPVATGTIDFLDGAAVIATNVPLVNGPRLDDHIQFDRGPTSSMSTTAATRPTPLALLL